MLHHVLFSMYFFVLSNLIILIRISKGYKKSLDNFHCYGQVASRQPPLVNGIHQTLSDDKEYYSMFKDQNILNSDQDSAYFVLDREEKKVPN